MYSFPKGLYTDVRLEDISLAEITYQNGDLSENLNRKSKGGFIRIYDGQRWYYSSTTDISNIQKEIDELALMARRNNSIEEDPIVKKLETNKGEFYEFKDKNLRNISQDKKLNLLKSYFPLVENSKAIKRWRGIYIERQINKEFYSSKGANLKFDYQTCAVVFRYSLNVDGKTLDEGFDKTTTEFNELKNLETEFKEKLNKHIDFTKDSKAVEPGKYTVIFSPIATGVFTHESFGHKSEADFMVGDEVMMKEWTLGKKVGSDKLTIVDTGQIIGSGFVPFDDEGTKARKTYLIKDGILSGRLHSSLTAESLNEKVTGNARAVSFEFEPIVRMTTTYIEAGEKSKENLISELKEGILIEDINHGSGMSTFTIAPSVSYMIRNGKIAEPVNISVVSGNVMKTLHEIDGISKEIELLPFALGGCGKMEQFPLQVGMGGPYIRVNNITVQ